MNSSACESATLKGQPPEARGECEKTSSSACECATLKGQPPEARGECEKMSSSTCECAAREEMIIGRCDSQKVCFQREPAA